MNDSKVPNWLINASNRIIEHMNEDHSNSIVSTLNAQHGIKDNNAKMEKLLVTPILVLIMLGFHILKQQHMMLLEMY